MPSSGKAVDDSNYIPANHYVVPTFQPWERSHIPTQDMFNDYFRFHKVGCVIVPWMVTPIVFITTLLRGSSHLASCYDHPHLQAI